MPSYKRLTHIFSQFDAPDLHSFGFAASSNFAVDHTAAEQYRKNGLPLSKRLIAAAALQFERCQSELYGVAANDAYTIAEGGVVRVRTTPNSIVGSRLILGDVTTEQIHHDPVWIADHVLLAFNQTGVRHDAPNFLQQLIIHPTATQRVRQFSQLAELAGNAIEMCRIHDLARAVNQYRIGFDEWAANAYGRPLFTQPVQAIAAELTHKFPSTVLGWKPPGAGASESMIVLVTSAAIRNAVIDFFESRHWTAMPAIVTRGVRCESMIDSDVRITAGYRLDFIGASDLGQDVAIGQPGCCCSCAIEPRSQIRFSTQH